MANRPYSYRAHKRFVKGMRRIKIDRAEHGGSRWCECFCSDADKGKGELFDRFANHPKYYTDAWKDIDNAHTDRIKYDTKWEDK